MSAFLPQIAALAALCLLAAAEGKPAEPAAQNAAPAAPAADDAANLARAKKQTPASSEFTLFRPGKVLGMRELCTVDGDFTMIFLCLV